MRSPRLMHVYLCGQVPPCYADLDRLVYEELEARVEEAVRAALYGARGGARQAAPAAAILGGAWAGEWPASRGRVRQWAAAHNHCTQ